MWADGRNRVISSRIASVLCLTAVLFFGALSSQASFADGKSATKSKPVKLAKPQRGTATESAKFLGLVQDKSKRILLRLEKSSDGKEIEIPLKSLALEITGQGERDLLQSETMISTNVTYHPPKAMDQQSLTNLGVNLAVGIRAFKPIAIWNNFANGRSDATLTSDQITVHLPSGSNSSRAIPNELAENQFPVLGRIESIGEDGRIVVVAEEETEDGVAHVSATIKFDKKTEFVNVVSSDPFLLDEGADVVLEGKNTKTHGFKPAVIRATLAEPLSADGYRDRAAQFSKLSKTPPKTPVRAKKPRSPDEDS